MIIEVSPTTFGKKSILWDIFLYNGSMYDSHKWEYLGYVIDNRQLHKVTKNRLPIGYRSAIKNAIEKYQECNEYRR